MGWCLAQRLATCSVQAPCGLKCGALPQTPPRSTAGGRSVFPELNKQVKGSRLGAGEVSVLPSPGDDRGHDTE